MDASLVANTQKGVDIDQDFINTVKKEIVKHGG